MNLKNYGWKVSIEIGECYQGKGEGESKKWTRWGFAFAEFCKSKMEGKQKSDEVPFDIVNKTNTRKELAKIAGVSHDTIEKIMEGVTTFFLCKTLYIVVTLIAIYHM